MKFDIKHDSKSKKFYTIIGGKECNLKYEKINHHILDLRILFVPKNLRGQGIASRVVEYAMHYALKNSLKIKPTCSYVGTFLKKRLEFQELVEKTVNAAL